MPDNSMTLSAEQQDAYRLDAELKHNAQAVIGGIVEIGRCLKEINDRKLYEYLGFNGLAEYAEASVGLKERAAYNYITAYETYGTEGLNKYGSLGITKLVALAQLNDEDRTDMLESGKAEKLSTRKLKDEIKELKGENDQLRFKLEEAQRPVVAAMSDEEKDEIRREAEKKAKEEADKEVERLKNRHDKDVKTYEKAIKDYMKDADEQESKIEELTSKLEKLQANAKTPPLTPTGTKEALKFYLKSLESAYSGAVEALERFDANEREKYKAALIKIAGDIKSAVEKM